MQIGNNALSDSCWHYVEIRRKRMRLTVILDRGNTGKATANASEKFVTLNLNNQSNVIYYGGAPPEILRSAKVKPVSFKGFLKQFRFEEFNVLDNALLGDKGFSITGTDRVKRAWPSNWSLHTAEVQCKAAEGSTSGCSPSEDDSDSCKPSSIPTEGEITSLLVAFKTILKVAAWNFHRRERGFSRADLWFLGAILLFLTTRRWYQFSMEN